MKVILCFHKPNKDKGYEQTLNLRNPKSPMVKVQMETIKSFQDVFNFFLLKFGEDLSDQNWLQVTAKELIEGLTKELTNRGQDDEYTRRVKLVPKSNANWHPLCVATYSPKVEDKTFYNKGISDRLAQLTSDIRDASKRGAKIFIGPECFFYQPEQDGTTKKPCSEEDKETVDQALQKLADENPKLLIIAGTILWQRDSAVFNTLLKYCSSIKLNSRVVSQNH